jgi:alpha-mannosidase
MRKIILLAFLAFALVLRAQTPGSWPASFYKGYVKTLKGGGFQYHSPQPDVTSSMLVRSLDSLEYVEWQTEAVPAGFKGQNACFVWLYGIDANAESHRYYLGLNGDQVVEFANPLVSGKTSTTIQGIKGVTLIFLPTMLDKYDDPMGYAILTVPASLLKKGVSQTLRVHGETAGSRTWYMTFEAGVAEKMGFVQQEAVLRTKTGERFSGNFTFVHLGEPEACTVTVKGLGSDHITLNPGFNVLPVQFPVTVGEQKYSVTVSYARQKKADTTVTVRPVRHWTIYLVQHTHTDIGYTRPQTEILPEHLRYIDFALDYCDQTDSLPDDARFRWTCETTWAVREYLNTRPTAQIERLKKRVTEGRIEIAGLFLNSSDLADEASVAASLQPVRLIRQAGLSVTAAMQDDINGVPWCLADYLPGCGIKYLSMAQNTHRAQKPFTRPTTFWWESPSGNRILVNRPEHYMWANTLGILTNEETFGKNLFNHLNDIVRQGYPFDRYALHFSGYLTDNSPPSTKACGLVRQWNEDYVWPKLRLATISEFPAYMEKNHSDELQVVRGAWPDWWMDGFGSAALETAYTRMAHEDFIANNGLASLGIMMKKTIPAGIPALTGAVSDAIAFYDEHTFGAAESITDPLTENSVVQWGEKSSYCWDAVKKNRILREELMGVIQPALPKFDVPSITVVNSMTNARSGVVTVFIDHEIIPRDRKFRIVDDQGHPVAVQAVGAREDGTYWALWAKDVPPLGYRSYRIYKEDEPRKPASVLPFRGVLENEYYRVRISTGKGGVVSIFDKQLGMELADSSEEYLPGQFIYERLGKNRHQLELLRLEEFIRTVPGGVTVSGITEGPVWSSATLNGSVSGCADADGISCEIRLYHTSKMIEFRYSMKKLAVQDPEGAYVAFPFNLKDAGFTCEVDGGPMVPGKEQLEGSSSDWIGMQNFVSLKNDKVQVVYTCPEIPLVQLGGLNLGKFARVADPKRPVIYSWVLNNYWTTNFRAYQEGELKWSCFLTSTADLDNRVASDFGWGERMPLLTRIFPASKSTGAPASASLIGTALQDLLLISAWPGGDGHSVTLQLRNPGDEDISINIQNLLDASGANFAEEVNVVGGKVKDLTGQTTVAAKDILFLRLAFIN